MSSSAKWGLTCIAAAVISLILLGLSDGLHAPALAWASLVFFIGMFILAGIAGAKGRVRNRRLLASCDYGLAPGGSRTTDDGRGPRPPATWPFSDAGRG